MYFKKLLALGFVLGLFSASALACGGDKDDDGKNGYQASQEISTIYCGGNKDDDKNP